MRASTLAVEEAEEERQESREVSDNKEPDLIKNDISTSTCVVFSLVSLSSMSLSEKWPCCCQI